MKPELTPSQQAALDTLASGPGNIAIVHYSKLHDAGLIVKTGESSGKRGFVHVRKVA